MSLTERVVRVFRRPVYSVGAGMCLTGVLPMWTALLVYGQDVVRESRLLEPLAVIVIIGWLMMMSDVVFEREIDSVLCEGGR